MMAVLKTGSLSKLLEDMNVDKKGPGDFRKPVLLQIRSIIPVLEKDEFWPNRGFYLKVSDLSHATYVSLPHEQDDMILSNKLQLGQFIYVQNLEAALPVPVLRGVMPVSCRRACEGTPEDILPVNNLVKFLEASDSDVVKDKGVISEKKAGNHGLPDTQSSQENSSPRVGVKIQGKLRSTSATKIRPKSTILSSNAKVRELQRTETSSVDNDTDSDSSKSTISSSTRISKRRSWNTGELLDVKDIFDSSTEKPAVKTKPRSRSVSGSPARVVRDDSSDDNATLIRRRRALVSNANPVKSFNKSISTCAKSRCEACPKTRSEKKGEERKIKWDSLPPSLVKVGEDMVRHKDVATLAAVEALQEACAAQKLIECLSIYSEIKAAKGDDDPQTLIDKFFELQDSLSQTRLILQSLTNISPVRTPDSDMNSTSSIKEVLNLAVERKKQATSRIKSAISSDLSPCDCSSLKLTKKGSNVTKTEKRPSSFTNRVVSTPKVSCIVRKEKVNSEIKGGVGSDIARSSDWVKGSTYSEASNLANVLQDESRKSFMGYVERFLDEAEERTSVRDSDTKIASMMCRIKKVNDWLDVVSKGGPSVLDESDIEACGRIRNKIYSVLLKHVERTALALENMNKAGLK